VLVHSLTSANATLKTFELVAEREPASVDVDALLAPLAADVPGALDAVRDASNMPLEQEPQRVRDDLHGMTPASTRNPL